MRGRFGAQILPGKPGRDRPNAHGSCSDCGITSRLVARTEMGYWASDIRNFLKNLQLWLMEEKGCSGARRGWGLKAGYFSYWNQPTSLYWHPPDRRVGNLTLALRANMVRNMAWNCKFFIFSQTKTLGERYLEIFYRDDFQTGKQARNCLKKMYKRWSISLPMNAN